MNIYYLYINVNKLFWSFMFYQEHHTMNMTLNHLLTRTMTCRQKVVVLHECKGGNDRNNSERRKWKDQSHLEPFMIFYLMIFAGGK